LAAASDQLAGARAAGAALRARVAEVRGADMAQRLPALEAAIEEGRRARELAEGPVKGALMEWWQQPAQHAAGWITRERGPRCLAAANRRCHQGKNAIMGGSGLASLLHTNVTINKIGPSLTPSPTHQPPPRHPHPHSGPKPLHR
jgi:hypothetical protein